MLKMIQAKYRSSYWLPESRRNIKLTRVQELDETSTVGKELIKYYPDNCEVDGQPYIQTVGIELPGLQSSASEIDLSVNDRKRFLQGSDFNDFLSGADFYDASSWVLATTGSGTASIETDTTNTIVNNKSLKITNTTPGANLSYTMWKNVLTESVDLSDVDTFNMLVYVDRQVMLDGQSGSSFGDMIVTFDSGDYTQSVKAIFNGGNIALCKGWNNIPIQKTDFTPDNTSIDWTSITNIRIGHRTYENQNLPIFYINSFTAGGEVPSAVPIVITTDDGFKESYDMINIMNRYGIKTSTFIMPDLVDIHADYFTLEQINRLYKKGNHIGIHHDIVNAFAIDPSLMLDVSNWLKDNGFTRDNGHLYGTYPNGAFNQATIDYAKSVGIKGMRTIVSRNRDDAIPSEGYLFSKGIASIVGEGIVNPFRLPSNKPLTVQEFKDDITEAIRLKCAYTSYHHKFAEFSKPDWLEIARWLKSKQDEGTIECVTMPTLYRRYSED